MTTQRNLSLSFPGWDARQQKATTVELTPDEILSVAAQLHAAAYAPAENDTSEGHDERQDTQQPLDKLVYRGGGGLRDGGRGSHSSSLIARLKRQSDATRVRSFDPLQVRSPGDPILMHVRGPRRPRLRWAAIVLEEDKAKATEALAPLCALRKEQQLAMSSAPSTGHPDGLIVMSRPRSSDPERWAARISEAAGAPLPDYLLFVGGPDRFPFDVQALLDISKMTGRLDFDGEGDSYWAHCSTYAQKAVRFEKGQCLVEPTALFYGFGIDSATAASRQDLIGRLLQYVKSEAFPSIDGRTLLPPTELLDKQATSAALRSALQAKRPALVFTASHGLEYPQSTSQWGALTDTSFVGSTGDDPLTAATIPDAAFAEGSVIVSFACFSAGVPRRSAIRYLFSGEDVDIAGAPFVSPLPKRLLGHPRGPVAFLGHVDRATSDSFAMLAGESVPASFASFCEDTLGGFGTLGEAMAKFRTQTGEAREALIRSFPAFDGRPSLTSAEEKVRRWIRYFDAQGYLLLGDPALSIGNASLLR